MSNPLALFALSGNADYAARLAARLGTSLLPVEEREFEDGEHKVRPLVPVEGRDACVLHSLHGDQQQSVNDKLCRLLFFIATLKDHGAARVTALVPYLCYARKDRRTQPFDPVTLRYVAAQFDAAGTDRVMTLEVHNLAAFENAFRRVTRHIPTDQLFAAHFAELAGPETDLVAISPDAGGVKRVELFRRALEERCGRPVGNGFIEKYRAGGVVTGNRLVGEVAGRTAIILDDLISTGGTLVRAALACRAGGARRVLCAATHGLFTGGAEALFASDAHDGLVIADTVPLPQSLSSAARRRITQLDSTSLAAAALIPSAP